MIMDAIRVNIVEYTAMDEQARLEWYATIWRQSKEMFDPGCRTVPRKTIQTSWEKWFAWYPVKVHGKRKWLTTVYRRGIISYVDMEEWNRDEYGTLFDVLNGSK